MIKVLSLFFCYIFSNIAYSQPSSNANELLSKLKNLKDSSKVEALFELGNFYMGVGKYDSNKYYLIEALEEAKKYNYIKGEGGALIGLSYVYKNEGNHDKALECLFDALKIGEKRKSSLGIADCKHAIAVVYLDLEQVEKAMPFFEEANKIYVDKKDSVRIVLIISQLGMCETINKNYNKAINYYKIVLEIYNRWLATKSDFLPVEYIKNYRSSVIINYSECLTKTKRPKDAIVMLTPALEEAITDSNIISIITIQDYLTSANLQIENYTQALIYANKNIQYLNKHPELPLIHEIKDAYESAALAYYKLGSYKMAYENQVLFKTINDSMFNETKAKVISEMAAKYEAEKKNLQINQLNKEKKRQRLITLLSTVAFLIALGLLILAYKSKKLQQKLFLQKEELIQKQKDIEIGQLKNKMMELEQMALRSQMNPHFIFNSLNAVQYFVMKNDQEGVNKYLTSFAHLIRQTLDNSATPFISIDEEIKYIETFLSLEKVKYNNKFIYHISIAENIDRLNIVVPSMILQPFVENCIKHGIANKELSNGIIDINISKNGKLIFSIKDNGIGRYKAAEFKSVGSYEYESKGMKITEGRIDLINKMYDTNINIKTIDLSDENGNSSGTNVIIEVPLEI